MLYSYLKENYKPNEPIFVSDIELPVTNTNLRQMFKVLCDSGKIKRFDNGVYYIPAVSRLKGGTSITADTVVLCRYVTRKGKREGYYSGFTFANQLGLTLQVPYVIEIVTNNTCSKMREVNLKGQRVILRKPRVEITEDNYKVLQLLDLLKDVELYADDRNNETAERVCAYIRAEGISQNELDSYISLYPDRVYKSIYEMRIYNVLA